MGTLRELSSDKNVHLLITNSNLVEIYVYDTLKKNCKATLESVYEVGNRSEFMGILELVGMQPYLAEKWLFIIDYSKLKALVKQYKDILHVNTSCFLFTAKNYSDFKEFKELYPAVNDLYLSIIRQSDVVFLLRPYKLSSNMVEFIAKSYGRDPEKIFILLKELEEGLEVETQRDIVKVCGIGSGSVASFVLSLLNDSPTSNRGLNRVLKNRIQKANELIGAYGVSSFRNFLVSTVKDILDIKILYMEGIIYKSIRGIPECYDEKKLSRYNMYLKKITEEIPYDRIIRLYLCLKGSGKWKDKSSMVQFIYDYYGGYCDADIG